MSGLGKPLFTQPSRLDELDAAIGSIHAAQQQRTDTSLTLAQQTPAPQARSQAKVAKAWGIDPASVPATLMAPSEHADLIRQDGPLSSWLSNPTNAAQAQDDLGPITTLSALVKQNPMAAKKPDRWDRALTIFGASSARGGELQDLRWSQMFRDFTPEEEARAVALSQKLALQEQQAGEGMNPVLRAAASVLPSMIQGITAQGKGAAAIPGFGALGSIGASFYSTLKMEAAGAMDETMQRRTVAGNAISQKDARYSSLMVGLVNATIELGADLAFTQIGEGLGKVSKVITPPALRETIAQATRRAVGQLTTRSAVQAFGTAYLEQAANEFAQEGLQSVAQGVSNMALNVANDQGAAYGASDLAGDVYESGKQAALAMVALGLPLPLASFSAQGVKIARGHVQADFIAQMADASRPSVTREQAPDTHKALLQAVGAKDKVVYVPAESWATFYQAQGIDPVQAAQSILGDAGPYLQATTMEGGTGTLMAIPMDVFLTDLVGKSGSDFFEAVKGDVKLNPHDFSANEAAAEAKAMSDPAVVERLLAEMQAALPQAVQGEDAIRQNVSAQLQAAGVKPEQAAPLAELHALVYRSLADRSGQAVTDLAAQRDVTILGGRQAAAALRPAAALAPDGIPSNLTALSAGDFDAALARAAAQRDQAYADANLIPESVLESVSQAGNTGTGKLTEDLVGAIEAAGYTVEEWQAAKATMAKAKFVLATRERTMARFAKEQARRAGGGIVRQSSAELANGPDVYGDQAATDVVDDFIGADGQPLFQVGVPVDGRVLYQSAPTTITVDGVERSAVNSDGRPIAGSPEALTAFWRWFGDSKVVDAQGRPVVVYHGTAKAFTKVDFKKGAQNLFWFTSDRAAIEGGEVGASGQGVILPLYAKITGAADWKQYDQLGLYEFKSRGLDGAILPESDGSFTGFVMAEPTQIKSADRNAGTFDGSNPSILFQGQSDPNGFIQFTEDGHKVTIGLLKTANLSTFLHESAHLFAEMLLETAARDTASEALKADAATIRDWLGAPDGPLTRDQHEQFARGFEAYLGTGKAPSLDLASLFGKFRVWIVSVYKDLRKLNVELTPEVTAVFDRMIAGENAVADAQDDLTAGRFTSAEQGQMTPEQFATYQQHGSEAAEAFAAKLQARLREETARESRQWWKDQTAQRSDEMRAALLEQPVYQALAALAGDEKLPRQWVEDTYVPDVRKVLTQKKLTTKDGGVDPSEFAVVHGFPNEAALIDALLTSEPIERVVAREVAASMARDYGDLRNDSAAMAQAVQAALHDAAGDPLAQVLADELAALGRARGIEVPRAVGKTQLQSIRDLAKSTIARIKLSELRPAAYLAAERKAAKEVEAALTAGKQQEAYAAKRRQLLNHVFYAEAVQGLSDAREARKMLVSYTTTKVRAKIGKIGEAWLTQIDGLLERVDLKQRSKDATQAIDDFRDWLEAQQAAGDPLAQSLGMVKAIPGVPYT